MNVIEYRTIEPNSPVVLRARLADENGTLLTIATTTSITVVVTDLSTGDASDPITVDHTTAMYNTLQLTNWSKDIIGFNCAIKLDGTNFPNGVRTYQVVATITPSSGDVFRKAWHLQTVDVI